MNFLSLSSHCISSIRWHRSGIKLCYFRNHLQTEDGDRNFYTLSWSWSVTKKDDTLYFAHCYPYTYSVINLHMLIIKSILPLFFHKNLRGIFYVVNTTKKPPSLYLEIQINLYCSIQPQHLHSFFLISCNPHLYCAELIRRFGIV